MADFQFTKNMAFELGDISDESAHQLGRAFADALDMAALGVAVVTLFVPGHHLAGTMVSSMIDATAAATPEFYYAETARHLDASTIAAVNAAARARQAPDHSLQPTGQELEPCF